MMLYRLTAIGISGVCAGAMLYVGLYQARAVKNLWCPVFDKGCETVANAPFARPFGIPDGFIGLGLYLILLALLLAPVEQTWIWIPLLVLSVFATAANILGLWDMVRLGSFCIYCVTTTLLSPALLWAVWELK